jgi:hypothetical protein
MKFLSTLIMIIGLAFASLAQDAPPVTWASSMSVNNEGTYLNIQATMLKDWHIFAHQPGGDDMIIPTDITLTYTDDAGKKYTVPVTDRQANKKPATHYMDGIGDVKYFEDGVVYTAVINEKVSGNITITISYQTCNNKMCLPPANVVLTQSMR